MITSWYNDNKLSLSINKCSTMVIDFTNTGQNHKSGLRCNGIILHQLDCFKYLGIVIDNQLKWERHITESN